MSIIFIVDNHDDDLIKYYSRYSFNKTIKPKQISKPIPIRDLKENNYIKYG
jgi:hypothetical protein